MTNAMTDESKKSIKAKGIYLLPNLLTIGALFAGFFAIVVAMRHQFDSAAIAIFVALVLDGLDGRVARLTQTQSEFGAQLDSLSDMVSFGVAPALVLYVWALQGMGKAGWLAAFTYAVCTALRLARFNIQPGGKRYFIGLATPAAAACVASLIWVCHKYGVVGSDLSHVVAVLAFLLGFLKVSNIPYRSFKDIDIRNNVPFTAILLVVLVFVLISFDPPDVLFMIFGGYVLSGPVMYVWCFLTGGRDALRVKVDGDSKSHRDESD